MAPETKQVAQAIERLIDLKLAQIQHQPAELPGAGVQMEGLAEELSDAVAQLSVALQRLTAPVETPVRPMEAMDVSATEY